MIINSKKFKFKMLLLAAAVLIPFSLASAIDPVAAEALEKMPVGNAEIEYALDARLVEAGPEAISQICDLIVSPGTGDDTKARYTLSSLSFYTSRPNAESQRKMYSAALVKALAKATDNEVKSFFIIQLQLTGTVEAIEALSGYLSSERLCEPASRGLRNIGTKAAEDAILNAFPSASQKNLLTIIYALGQMQIKSAADDISRYAKSTDRTLRLVSLGALAEIGDPDSEKILDKALNAGDAYEKGIVASYNVRFAQRLLQAGETKDAVGICKDILRSKDSAINSGAKSAALSVLVEALGVKSLDYLIDAFDDGDEQLQSAAMTLAATMDGSSITKAWCKKLKKASSSHQIKIVKMLGSRGDQKALEYLRDTYSNSDNQVKTAVLKAIVALDKAEALSDLIGAVSSGQQDQIKTAKSLMMQLPTEQFATAAIKLLPKLSTEGKVALIEILAQRHVSESMDTVFSLTASKDSSVNFAATRALSKIAGPDDLNRIIDLMLNAETSRQRSEASRVIIKLSSQIDDVQVTSKPLLAAMRDATVDQQVSIINLLPSIGSKQAFKVVVDQITSSNAQISDAAIRSLAKWKDAEAIDVLLKIAFITKELNYNVITLKALTALVIKSDMPPASKAVYLEKAIDAAKRLNEKKFVLSKLAQVKSVETLAIAVKLLDDETLSNDAAKALVMIALPGSKGGKGLTGPGVGGLLLEAYTKTADAKLRKDIDRYVRSMNSPKSGNLALDKPVSISCKAEGSHKPQLAVDGRNADTNIYYSGEKSPSWFQVDLEKVTPIESVHIWFYWDGGRYYQYTIEVSTDGKKFTQVVDQSKKTTPSTAEGVVHKFNAIDARYVRVNILKNSANPAIHLVELEVYAKGSGQIGTVDQIETVNQKQPPEGFRSLFNGKDLSGWKGLMAGPNDNPVKRAKLTAQEYISKQAQADASMREHWYVVDGMLYFDGGKGGHSLATERDYGDFEMLVDWKLMHDNGDSGLYLRGSPQVQIWDPAHWKIGSGGLYNNKKNPSKPTMIADNPIGQWNTFRIKMIGEKVTVHLNDKLVVDNVTLENYWNRSIPIFSREQIELQCHGNPVCFRNIFIREIKRPGEFVSLFNGRDLAGWIGDTKGYIVENGEIVCKPGGNLYTEDQYSDFVLRFDFKLTAGANNGLGIRTSQGVNAAYEGMELQILDNTADKYKKLFRYQYHGSVYGVVPAERGYLKPVGQWNSQEVIAKGDQIKVILNGVIIVDANIREASKNGTMDHKPHPGLLRKTGQIGFLGHGSVVHFRNIKINELD